MRMRIRVLMFTCCPLAAAGGCVAAAAGAGAIGAVTSSTAARKPLCWPRLRWSKLRPNGYSAEIEAIKETKTGLQQEGGGEKRVVEGTMDDREISVDIETAGTGSKVVVIARKSMVTWDKELARQFSERIVAGTK